MALQLDETSASRRVLVCPAKLTHYGISSECIGLQTEYRGRGFAYEACLAAIEYLWRSTGFQLVYARTDPPK